MFYDRFIELCNEKGVKPGRACIDMGVSRSLAAKWKATGTEKPSADVLEKMSDYFGVTIDYLLGGGQKEKPLVNDDEELTEYLDALRTRPEIKMMFQLAKGATKEDVEKAVRVIEAMLGKD